MFLVFHFALHQLPCVMCLIFFLFKFWLFHKEKINLWPVIIGGILRVRGKIFIFYEQILLFNQQKWLFSSVILLCAIMQYSFTWGEFHMLYERMLDSTNISFKIINRGLIPKWEDVTRNMLHKIIKPLLSKDKFNSVSKTN